MKTKKGKPAVKQAANAAAEAKKEAKVEVKEAAKEAKEAKADWYFYMIIYQNGNWKFWSVFIFSFFFFFISVLNCI